LLFDLDSDPGEYIDLSPHSDMAEILADHRHQMLKKVFTTTLPKRREWAY